MYRGALRPDVYLIGPGSASVQMPYSLAGSISNLLKLTFAPSHEQTRWMESKRLVGAVINTPSSLLSETEKHTATICRIEFGGFSRDGKSFFLTTGSM